MYIEILVCNFLIKSARFGIMDLGLMVFYSFGIHLKVLLHSYQNRNIQWILQKRSAATPSEICLYILSVRNVTMNKAVFT